MQSLQERESFNNIAAHPLQTWEWGEFRKAWGNEVLRTDYGQLTLHRIPYTPYKVGAFIKGPAPTEEMLDELKRIGKENNLIFIKMEPSIATSIKSLPELDSGTAPMKMPNQVRHDELIKLFKSHGAMHGKTLFTPTTFWIDLTLSEEELLKSFDSKTRYNIRYAERKGVTVVEDNSEKAFQRYLELTEETAKRQSFFAHNRKYHELMWEHLHKKPIAEGRQPIARLLTALYNNEIITTWILFSWKDFLYYPYGASTDKYKNVMANNLMVWEAIRLGKKLGLKTFDLWGREEGKGFTKFKEGYNPKVVEFLGTWDLVINKPVYIIYILAEKVRWFLLKLKGKLVGTSF